MVSYLQDTNTLEVYDGAAWVGATGDITGLTAGTGISITSETGPVPTVTNSMATEITAKGDLIVGTGSATFDNLAAGSNGETLVADSSASTGLRWQGDYAAGKNKIINGDFGVWQRSTSATVTTDATYFAPDRFASTYSAGGATVTWSRQTFTPGTAPVAGYEGLYFSRLSATSGGAGTEMGSGQRIENVQTFAGQTATFSFWAKADSSRTATIYIDQVFGSGGSATVAVNNSTFSVTTSWTRFTVTVNVPSISGKTIGTGSFLRAIVYYTTGQASGSPVLDTWGWQFEAGSVATAFQTATGTIQGELAACQRYYYRQNADSVYTIFASGQGENASGTYIYFKPPVTMRVEPTSVDYSTLMLYDGTNILTVSGFVLNATYSSKDTAGFTATAAGVIDERFYSLLANNSTSAYVGVSAEL
jgi:hypothetical protein